MNPITEKRIGFSLIAIGSIMAVAVMANSPDPIEEQTEKHKTLQSVRCYTLQEMTDEQLELTAYRHKGELIAVDIHGNGHILDLREKLDAESKKKAVDFVCNMYIDEKRAEEIYNNYEVVL